MKAPRGVSNNSTNYDAYSLGSLVQIHIFLKKKGGIIYAYSKECPVDYKGQKRNEITYMGHTLDSGWPKKMSTGRVLYKPIENPLKSRDEHKKKKLKKAALSSKN